MCSYYGPFVCLLSDIYLLTDTVKTLIAMLNFILNRKVATIYNSGKLISKKKNKTSLVLISMFRHVNYSFLWTYSLDVMIAKLCLIRQILLIKTKIRVLRYMINTVCALFSIFHNQIGVQYDYFFSWIPFYVWLGVSTTDVVIFWFAGQSC